MTIHGRTSPVTPAMILFALLWAPSILSPALSAAPSGLLSRLSEVPFCYPNGAVRSWPLFSGPLRPDHQIILTAKREGTVLASSENRFLEVGSLFIRVRQNGKLEVESQRTEPEPEFELEIKVRSEGAADSTETVSIRPAPPVRQVSYYADLVDDLINIFGVGIGAGPATLHHELTLDRSEGKRRPPLRSPDGRIPFPKEGFDQYFRRLQCHGQSRLIVALTPFPLLTDPSVYSATDWDRFEKQARAILDSAELTQALATAEGFSYWIYLRDLMAFRLDPQAQKSFTDSALEHGIPLSISLQPFEHAVSKFHQVPVFDSDGSFLWDFLPMASPTVNYHPEEVGFAHYREILSGKERPDRGQIGSIQLPAPKNLEAFLKRFESKGDNLRIWAADYPPILADSFALQRQDGGRFRLRRFAEIRKAAEARRHPVTGFTLRSDPQQGLVIENLNIPNQFRFILVENPSGQFAVELKGADPAVIRSKLGATLGRTNQYWAFPDPPPGAERTLVAGIPANGDRGYLIFFASEHSAEYVRTLGSHVPLSNAMLVIDRGEPYSSEMVDFNQPASRRHALGHLRHVFRYPAFSEIFVNTRSHIQLAGHMGDGDQGILPRIEYRQQKARHMPLGIDLGYAPRQVADHPELQALARDQAGIEQLTTWQPGEWQGTCLTAECAFRWRYLRNVSVADGVRLLLQDVVAAFPDKPVRVVLPERDPVVRAVAQVAAELPPGAVPYTASRNNHIQRVGEATAMVDLKGLSVQPVILGTGPLVDPLILKTFLREAAADLKEGRASSLTGPAGIFYEGQSTLRSEAGRAQREMRMCMMLSHPDVSEVIVHEAADWTYLLPLSDPDHSGHGFLERCDAILKGATLADSR